MSKQLTKRQLLEGLIKSMKVLSKEITEDLYYDLDSDGDAQNYVMKSAVGAPVNGGHVTLRIDWNQLGTCVPKVEYK